MAQTIYLSGLIKWLFTSVCPLQGQNLRQTKVGHVVFRPHDICRIAVHLPRVFLNDGRQVDYPDLIDIPWLDVDARPLPRSYTSKNTKRLCFGQSQLCLLSLSFSRRNFSKQEIWFGNRFLEWKRIFFIRIIGLYSILRQLHPCLRNCL